MHPIRTNTESNKHPNLVGNVIGVKEVLVLFAGELVAVILVQWISPEHVAQRPLHLWLGEAVDLLDVRQVLDLTHQKQDKRDKFETITRRVMHGGGTSTSLLLPEADDLLDV